MAYRSPRYSYVHAAREVGAAAVTVSDTAHTDFPEDNLIDDRAATLFMWSAGVTNPTIDIDLGADFDTGLNRLIIPANHNIELITVNEDTDSNYGSMDELNAADDTINAGEQYDSGTFDTASTQRYIRIIITGGSVQYYLPQIFLTKIATLTVGPVLSEAPDWKKPNITQLAQPTGLLPTIQHGPDQRVLEYPYEYRLSGADLTAMEAFVSAVGMHSPFFVDPAEFHATPGTDEPPLWMRFAEMPQPRLAVDIPITETRSKIYTLRLIESLD
jgi:hypothetical protein